MSAVCWNGHAIAEGERSCQRCGAHAAPDWASFEAPPPWWRRTAVLVPLLLAVAAIVALVIVLAVG